MRFVGNAFLFVAAGLAALPARAECYPESAQAATVAAEQARDWRDVHAVFVRFGICDDGRVAKSFSESIVRILAEHWDSVVTLNRLAAADPKFKRFVLRHLNSLMTSDQARSISQNAQNNCPSRSRALCTAVIERISQAARE